MRIIIILLCRQENRLPHYQVSPWLFALAIWSFCYPQRLLGNINKHRQHWWGVRQEITNVGVNTIAVPATLCIHYLEISRDWGPPCYTTPRISLKAYIHQPGLGGFISIKQKDFNFKGLKWFRVKCCWCWMYDLRLDWFWWIEFNQ